MKKCPACNSTRITFAVISGDRIIKCKRCGYIHKMIYYLFSDDNK